MFDTTLFDTFTWDVWLGIGSGLLLVVGLLLAAARRSDGDDAYRTGTGPRRSEPMPLYQEGGLS